MNIFSAIFSKEIKTNPDSPVILMTNNTITYNELNSLVGKTVSLLKQKKVKEKDYIALLFNNELEFIIAILSLWKIRAVPIPLNTKLHEKDLTEQIEFIKPKLTIKSTKLVEVLPNKKSLALSLDDIWILKEHKIEIEEINSKDEETALILFTSGSSGKPKAVELTFNNLFQSALIGNKVLNHTVEDKWLASLPFYHIGGFSIIFRALFFGASIIIPESLSYKHLAESIINYKPTLASLVSNQLKYFVDENIIPPKELRTVLLGGGYSDKNLILKAIEKGWRIAKVYGSTETSSFVSFMNTEEVMKKPGASGKVIPPNKIIVTDEGEITVKSPAVMMGYFNNDEETADKFTNDFFRTGDIGYLDEEGYLFVEAKRIDLIVSGGENINPVEVENAILTHKDVAEVCVVGIEDEQWGQVVSAAVILKPGIKLSEKELETFLKKKIASFKVPRKIIFVNHLPKSELTKVLRGKVKDLFINLT